LAGFSGFGLVNPAFFLITNKWWYFRKHLKIKHLKSSG